MCLTTNSITFSQNKEDFYFYMPDRSMLMPGRHRPIYLWAGPGTIRMNRLKFMNAPIDQEVHLEAHQAAGVRRVVNEMGCN
jgi:hypothetical protein